MALLNPGKVGIGAWADWIVNGQPVTGDPNNPTPSQATLDAINAIGFKFYQSWHPTKLTGNQGAINFIPAWWNNGDGDGELTPANLAAMKADGDLIIGSNEPWNTFGQPNFGLSPSQALAVWPKLLALGNRLASPSISGPNDGNDWLAQFMAGANAKGYRVDVINVHYYSQYPNQDINAFKSYLQSVYNLYGKPLIVTEWALYSNWGDTSNPQVPRSAQAAWAIAGTQMMDTLDFVEKHFWYAAGDGAGGNLYLGSNAVNPDGSMSPVGQAFFQMLNPGQTLPGTTTTTLVAEFYKNGILVGTATKLPSGTLYPILSLANNTEAATANFGSSPLVFLPIGMTSWDGSQIGAATGTTPATTNGVSVFYPNKIGVYAVGVGNDEPGGAKRSAPGVVANALKSIGFRAYYTFDSAGKIAGVDPSVAWLPAFWDNSTGASGSLNSTNLAQAQASGNLIIGFNEPWNSFGFRTPITPTQALDAWPTLMALGNRLATPSISGPTDGNDWLAQFMAGVASRGYRVDVINVHYYGGPGATITDFKNYLQSVYDLYGKPLIVTEWARANWSNNPQPPTVPTPTFSVQDQVEWAKAGIQMMDSLDFVERHFWYGLTTIYGTYQNEALINQDGSLTPVGQVFHDTLTSNANLAGGTLSPTDKYADIVLANDKLSATYTTANGPGNKNIRGTKSGLPSRYFEVKFTTLVAGQPSTAGIGLANATQSLSAYPGNPNGIGWFASGYAEWPQSGTSYNFGNFGAGDVLGVLLEANDAKLYKNGVLVGTATQLPAGQLYPVISFANNTESATVNFGATPLSFLPAGSASWDGSQTRAGVAAVGGFVCDGDSLTFGAAQDGNPVTPYPTQLASLTGKPAINLGISGQTIATMNANYAANVAPRFNASTANALILEGGANDIIGNATASQIDASVRSYCAKARATGYKVYLLTMPPFPQGGVIGGAPSPTIAAVNADRRANWAQYCDGLIDIAANPAFSDDTNRTYFQADQTHWTTAADAVVANMVKTAVLG
jgi:hypothetical protein